MARTEGRIYRFADFTLEAREHRLRRGDQEIYLRPKPFETLVYLLERHGHLVEKNELLDTVWADSLVTESTLTHCIEEIRKALQDDAHHPQYIKTIPRLGFKFIADVEALPASAREEEMEEEITAVRVVVTKEDHEPEREEGQREEWEKGKRREWENRRMDERKSLPPSPFLPFSLSLFFHRRWERGQKLLAVSVLLVLLVASGLYLYNGSGQPIRSLAVLPFANLSADPEQDYFADGMTEALIADLARLKSLQVISRTSVMPYKRAKKPLPEIARELHVDAVVEGSVLRSGDRVRITAQLIHAKTDRHLWGERYERDLRNILALQSEVAQAIARQIQITLTPQEQVHLARAQPIHPAAYEAYLKGRFYWNKRNADGFKKGVEYFQQTIQLEPTYALAYVGLADCYNMLNNYDVLPPRDSAPKAKAAATKALELDNTLAEGHASLAFTLMHYDWDWPGAEREFQQAIELNPNYAAAHHWYGLYLTAMERFDEAMTEMKRAQELDPLSLIINANVGWVFYFRRQYDQAIEQCRKTLEMDPNFTSAHVKLAWAYEQKGLYADAIAEFQKVLSLSPDDPALRTLIAHTHAVAGRSTEAMRIITELKKQSKRRYVSPYLIVLVYAGLGENDQAFDWLEKSYDNRCGWLAWLRVDPKLDSLRPDPRFHDLLRRLGLA